MRLLNFFLKPAGHIFFNFLGFCSLRVSFMMLGKTHDFLLYVMGYLCAARVVKVFHENAFKDHVYMHAAHLPWLNIQTQKTGSTLWHFPSF